MRGPLAEKEDDWRHDGPRAVDVLARDASHDPRQRPRQLNEISSIERQPPGICSADERGAQVRGRPLNQRVVGPDRERVSDASDFERRVDLDFFILV